VYRNERYAKVLSCTVNKELGQVKYIFLDKIGTLTYNKMDLKGIRVFNKCYGYKLISQDNDQEKKAMKATTVGDGLEFSFADPELVKF
jgi:P-type E1-E2 ATPase